MSISGDIIGTADNAEFIRKTATWAVFMITKISKHPPM
jgi:hypothetical protein